MRYRRIVIISLLLLTLGLLCGCGDSTPHEDVLRWTEQAKHNAIEYTRQKYGFSAHVTDAECDVKQGMFGWSSLPDVFVTLEHEGKTFQVYISGEGETAKGSDSYQSDLIERGLCEQLQTQIPGVRRVRISAYASNAVEQSGKLTAGNLYKTFYVGCNLDDILREETAGFTAYCVQSDLSAPEDFEFVREYYGEDRGFSAAFYSLRSEDLLEKPEPMLKMPVYCAESRILTDWGDVFSSKYIQYIRGEDAESGIIWCMEYEPAQNSDTAPYSVDTAPQSTFTAAAMPDLTQFIGRGAAKKPKAATGAYHFASSAQCSYTVYIPTSLIENYSHTDAFMNQYSIGCIGKNTDGSVHYYTEHTYLLGEDYLYFKTEPSDSGDLTFTVLYHP